MVLGRALDKSEWRRLKGSANPQDHPAVLLGLPLGLTVGWAGEWGPNGPIVEPATQDELRLSACHNPQKVPGWKSVCPDECGHATHPLGPRLDLQELAVGVAKTPNEKEEHPVPPQVPSVAPGAPRPLLAPRGRLDLNLQVALPEWRPKDSLRSKLTGMMAPSSTLSHRTTGRR